MIYIAIFYLPKERLRVENLNDLPNNTARKGPTLDWNPWLLTLSPVSFAYFHSVFHEAFEIKSVHSKAILEWSKAPNSDFSSYDPDLEPICTLRCAGWNKPFTLGFSTSASAASATERMFPLNRFQGKIPGEISLRINGARCAYTLSVMTH